MVRVEGLRRGAAEASCEQARMVMTRRATRASERVFIEVERLLMVEAGGRGWG